MNRSSTFRFPSPGTFFWVLSALLSLLLLLTGCALPFPSLPSAAVSSVEREYTAAENLLDRGQYADAAAAFEKLGSFEDASLLLMYSRAAIAAENGDYPAAHAAFSALGDFRDASVMLRYYEGRETEAAGRHALDTANYPDAIRLLTDASDVYASLPSFRDTESRASDCLGALYSRGRSLLDEGLYENARSLFASLGSWQDSADLAVYCEASLLEAEGASLTAADRFSAIPSVLDAASRAEKNREQVYQHALALSAEEEHEAAISLFSALGSYRDAEAQAAERARLLFGQRLHAGDYEGALFLMDAAPDAVPLQPADDDARSRAASLLDSFADAYLHFSANTGDAWYGYYGVLPYIEAGGALDSRFQQFLMIGSFSHNSNYNYYGSELLDLFALEPDYYLAYFRASAVVSQPAGPNEVHRTFRAILHDTDAGLLAGSIEDCLYGDQTLSYHGRPVVSGPLPNGELPPDEDGDGIIIVDIMKKGFNGTMIIVLDPSRVFVGYPGFYGGNGMILDELAARYDALGGINGGGFIDEDGGGSGGLPEGLTIVEGKSFYWAGSGASAAFDQNNILHVGGYTVESAAEAGIRDCVSFGPALIIDGVGEYGPWMESGINPRTGIGQRADGAVLLCVLDGRQIHSIGASYGDLRDVMIDFGAVNADSLDGGSSTVMYFNGEYLNSPSSASGTSRYLPNAFLIRK